ncbi:hypothetical protein FSP39_024418 [Pinctada imbricata]|uniref:VWFA domain-containing protein n=1 Tax=Pinctada imbricata TaxID=66713 RepID=A0AA88Y8U0_PINIB|nr:hypothetical protein FSP39_024418 [Pinctada imbricata]
MGDYTYGHVKKVSSTYHIIMQLGHIVYLIQTPDYLKATDTDELARLVYNVTERLVIGPNDSLVSVITFQDTQEVKIDIMDHFTNDTLLPEIDNLRATLGNLTGLTWTSAALLYLTTNNVYTRTEKYLVLVIFENSVSPGQTAFEAFFVRSDGISIIVIGIGPELSATSSEPRDHIASSQQDYLYVDNIKYLCWQVPNIAYFLDKNALRENIPDCPSPNVTVATTTPSPTTEKDFTFWIIFGSFLGASIVTVSIVVLCRCVQKNKRKTSPSMTDIENAVDMYRNSRLGQRRQTFCSESTVSNNDVDVTCSSTSLKKDGNGNAAMNGHVKRSIPNSVSNGHVDDTRDRNRIFTHENIAQKMMMQRMQ